MKKIILEFSFPGKPESYARERKGRGKHFYNPKNEEMQKLKVFCAKATPKEKRKLLLELFKDKESEFSVELELKFFLPIPKNDSKTIKENKISGKIRPTIRPDLDNYVKFVMDSMHDVLYDDDKRVVKVTSEKIFSEEPRSEIRAIIEIRE